MYNLTTPLFKFMNSESGKLEETADGNENKEKDDRIIATNGNELQTKIVNRKATKKEKSMLKGKVRFKVTVRFQKVTEFREAIEKWLDHDLR